MYTYTWMNTWHDHIKTNNNHKEHFKQSEDNYASCAFSKICGGSFFSVRPRPCSNKENGLVHQALLRCFQL